MQRSRNVAGGLATVLIGVAAAGCGGEGPQAPPPAQDAPAPIRSDVDPDAERQAVAAAVLAQGLDRLELPGGPDETDPGAPAARLRSQGPAPRLLPESPRRLARETPRALLASALDALAAKDVAALARLGRSPADKATLDEDDAADAERRFLSPAMRATWDRISVAVRKGAVQVTPVGADRRHRSGSRRQRPRDAGSTLARGTPMSASSRSLIARSSALSRAARCR